MDGRGQEDQSLRGECWAMPAPTSLGLSASGKEIYSLLLKDVGREPQPAVPAWCGGAHSLLQGGLFYSHMAFRNPLLQAGRQAGANLLARPGSPGLAKIPTVLAETEAL